MEWGTTIDQKTLDKLKSQHDLWQSTSGKYGEQLKLVGLIGGDLHLTNWQAQQVVISNCKFKSLTLEHCLLDNCYFVANTIDYMSLENCHIKHTNFHNTTLKYLYEPAFVKLEWCDLTKMQINQPNEALNCSLNQCKMDFSAEWLGFEDVSDIELEKEQ